MPCRRGRPGHRRHRRGACRCASRKPGLRAARARAAARNRPGRSRRAAAVSCAEERQPLGRYVGEERGAFVLARKQRLRDRPVDTDGSIVPAHARIRRRIVERGAEVGKGRAFGDDRESVREAFRNPEVTLVLRGQHRRGPAPEVRRAATDVDRDVVDLALEHADQLALRVRPLVVEATQHALHRLRDIALHEARVDPGLGEACLVPALVEEPALVAEYARLDHEATRQVGLVDFHRAGACSSSDSRYWP
jgi:hypothetical protein